MLCSPLAAWNCARGKGAGMSEMGAWIAVVGMRGWILDGDWEGGRYSNPCESAYVVAASVRASNCSGVSVEL